MKICCARLRWMLTMLCADRARANGCGAELQIETGKASVRPIWQKLRDGLLAGQLPSIRGRRKLIPKPMGSPRIGAHWQTAV